MEIDAVILMVISLIIIVGGVVFFVIMDFKRHEKTKQITKKKFKIFKNKSKKKIKTINGDHHQPYNKVLNTNSIVDKTVPLKAVIDADLIEAKSDEKLAPTTTIIPKVVKKSKRVVNKATIIAKKTTIPKSDNTKTTVIEGNITTIFDDKKMTVKIIKATETSDKQNKIVEEKNKITSSN